MLSVVLASSPTEHTFRFKNGLQDLDHIEVDQNINADLKISINIQHSFVSQHT